MSYCVYVIVADRDGKEQFSDSFIAHDRGEIDAKLRELGSSIESYDVWFSDEEGDEA